jgi:hypothetical protein
MILERVCMAAQDREDIFRRHFRNVLAELARQAAAEESERERREREQARLRRAREEVSNLIEV